MRSAIDVVLAPLADRAQGSPFVLLDFPDHSNVGDSAIWLGETAWLRQELGRMPAYICRQEAEWSVLERNAPEGTIFLHGGGNFGDIWPSQQLFRETVLERYKGRPVVQLPQSIHFNDPAAIERTAARIAAHGAFTLLVRDQRSLELARSRFDCSVALCPDMAFCLGPQQRSSTPIVPVLMLLRTDLERRSEAIEPTRLPSGWKVDDWLTDTPNLYKRARVKTYLGALSRLQWREVYGPAHEVSKAENLANSRLRRGVGMLSEAAFIITDRLHVHILATLLGIPHVCLDNSYGKIQGLSSAFDTLWDGARQVETLEEAMLIAKEHTAVQQWH